MGERWPVLVAVLAGCGPLAVDWPAEGVPCDDLHAYPLSLTWEDAPLVDPAPMEVELSHGCDAPARVVLVVEGGASSDAFQATVEDVWLEPGDAAVVDVVFAPSGYADASGALVLDAGGRTLALPLLGRVDPDQDGDGHLAEAAGGLDCDDLDASVHPLATEYRNARDDDCDGLADEGWIDPGDLVLTEVWPWTSPWVEVRNTSDLPVELEGWVLRADAWDWVVEGSTRVEPGALALLEPSLAMEPAGDHLVLWLGSEPLAGVDWDGTWPVTAEASLSLDPALERWPGDPASWCAAASPTPWVTNLSCPAEDLDGDGYTTADGDCDDGDPEVHPEAVELWDWVDRDCNGTVDDAVITEAASGQVDPGAVEFFWDPWLHVADGDGDGTELLFPVRDGGDTWILALEGAGLDGVDSGYASLSEVRLHNEQNLELGFGSDADGDGLDELVIRDLDTAVWVVPGASLGATATLADASLVVTWGEGWWGYGASLGPDLDGDGAAELVLEGYDGGQGSIFVVSGQVGVIGHEDADVEVSVGTSAAVVGSEYGPWWADLDGDGYDDVISQKYVSRDVRPLLLLDGGALLEAESVGDATLAEVQCCTGAEYPALADLDGDGQVDLVVSSSAPFVAQVLAFLDTPALGGSVFPEDADVTLEGDEDPWFGTSLAAGDLDGDGSAEVVVGSTHAIGLGTAKGTVHVFCGDALADGSLADACRSLAESPETHDAWALGHVVSAVDLDGDGLGDLSTRAEHYGDGGRIWFLLSGGAP